MDDNKVLGIDTDEELPLFDIFNQKMPPDDFDEDLEALKENYKNSITVGEYFDLLTKLVDDKEELGNVKATDDDVKIVNNSGEPLITLGDIINETKK